MLSHLDLFSGIGGFALACNGQTLPRKGRRSKASVAELVRDVILDRNLLT